MKHTFTATVFFTLLFFCFDATGQDGSVGINTQEPRGMLHVAAESKDTGIYSIARLYGVVGVDTIKTDEYSAGIFGRGFTNGVYGWGDKIGVLGEGYSTVLGSSIGVKGRVQYGIGVLGEAVSVAVQGNGEYNGVIGDAIEVGVTGKAWFTDPELTGIYSHGWGVYGYGFYGVRGEGAVYGINATATDDTGKAVYGRGAYGLYGDGVDYGVYARGRTGVYAITYNANNDALRAVATGSSGSWGVNASSETSYGIYAATNNAASYAGYFGGSLFSTGTYQGSDERLKRNIRPVSNGLDIISRLQPKYYEFRNDGDYAKMNLPAGSHYGLMAQEVEKVLPGLVKETQFDIGKIKAGEKANTKDGKMLSQAAMEEKIDFKALNYIELIPILIKATQELNEKVDELAKQNESLKEEIKLLKNKGSKIK